MAIPALVLDQRLDVLAMNRLARAFYPTFDQLPPSDWNMARFMFLDPAARVLYADWTDTARENVGTLRLRAGREPHDECLARLVDDLSADPDFRRQWNDQNVYRPTYGSKRYRHPVAPGSPSEAALRTFWPLLCPGPGRRAPARRSARVQIRVAVARKATIARSRPLSG
ncbi:MmyB family transcriptional regulator [Kitasatospora sp. NPDC004531]